MLTSRSPPNGPGSSPTREKCKRSTRTPVSDHPDRSLTGHAPSAVVKLERKIERQPQQEWCRG
jgi:hypothetical protein